MEDLASAESQGKCIKQHALTAAKNARFLSSRLKADLFIAGIATKNIGQVEIDIDKKYRYIIWLFFFYFLYRNMRLPR